MSFKEQLIQEMQNEAKSTEAMLSRIPEDKFQWQPHEKSMTLQNLATHITNLAGMNGTIAKTQYLDFAEQKSAPKVFQTTQELVDAFKQNSQASIEAVQNMSDQEFEQQWSMRAGAHPIMDATKGECMRKMGMNHLYHHRAQLGVYLRMLNVPIPGMYGPSADDRAAQAK